MRDDSRAGMKIQRKGEEMVEMTTALRHLRWADDLLFEQMATLPSEALDATYGPKDWTVSHLARHMVGSAEWFCFCLTGMPWTDLVLPRNPADLEAGTRSAMRSIVLAQACYHSTEHRTQIACALEVSGIPGITLDNYDLWAFATGIVDASA